MAAERKRDENELGTRAEERTPEQAAERRGTQRIKGLTQKKLKS
jgi:hypothetical protein